MTIHNLSTADLSLRRIDLYTELYTGSTRHYVQVTYTQHIHKLSTHYTQSYPQVIHRLNLSLHRFDLSTARPQLIHTLFTGYPQSYPQDKVIHSLSKGQSYPQVAHRVIHSLPTELSTGSTKVLLFGPQRQSYPQAYCTGLSLQAPYNPDAVVVIIRSRSGAVHPLLFEHECIIAGLPYTKLTTMAAVGLLFARAASTSIPDLLSNNCIITPKAYTKLTTLSTVRVFCTA